MINNMHPIVRDAFENSMKNYDFKSSIKDKKLSVTTLSDSPHIQWLRENNPPLPQPLDRLMYLVFGNATHYLMEQAGSKYSTEHRLSVEIGGWEISGKYDFFDFNTNLLFDFKYVTKYTQKAKQEYVAQSNILRYLIYKTMGIKPAGGMLIKFYRDWQFKDKFQHDMPDSPIEYEILPDWSIEFTEKYILDRIKVFESYNPEVGMCTPNEKWERPTTYALKGPNASRARKVCSSYSEALEHKKPTETIEIRQGEDGRCENYCDVNSYCKYYIGKQGGSFKNYMS